MSLTMSLSRNLGGGYTPEISQSKWIRPYDWLPLPTVGVSEQRIVGLFAVYDSDTNYVAFSVSGNYIVDWGDGVVENFNSGNSAHHSYNYSAISDSTLSSSGYKQVVISIIPQAGSNLTAFNLRVKHSSYSLDSNPIVTWLDLSINSPFLTSLAVGSSDANISLPLKQLKLGNNNLTSFLNLCHGLTMLESVVITHSGNVTSISNMFTNCYSLRYPPLFDTSKVTNASGVFRATLLTNGVISIPSYNLSACTNFSAWLSGSFGVGRCTITGVTRSISFANCNLSATAINEIFSNLGTAAGAQTITVTGNRGASTCNPSVATAKGWTVAV